MNVSDQAERLIDLGVARLANLTAGEFRRLAADQPGDDGAILTVHPSRVSPSALAPLLCRAGKPGFVVVDMTDLDEFATIAGIDLPATPLYLLFDLDRGDDLRNTSPDEALGEITRRGRRPLTINEALCWLLVEPDRLQPNHCFMAVGSRKPSGSGLDARTPAVWISGGTGRDGASRRGAPKVGWCWAGNRHTWLGFASCRG